MWRLSAMFCALLASLNFFRILICPQFLWRFANGTNKQIRVHVEGNSS